MTPTTTTTTTTVDTTTTATTPITPPTAMMPAPTVLSTYTSLSTTSISTNEEEKYSSLPPTGGGGGGGKRPDIIEPSPEPTIMYTNIRDNEASRSLHLKDAAYIDFQFFLPFHPDLMTRAAAIQEAIAMELQIGMSDVHIRECTQHRTERVLVKGWVNTIEKYRLELMERFHTALHKQKLSRRIIQITKIENPRLVVSQLRLAYTSMDVNNQPEIKIPERPNRQNSSSSTSSVSSVEDQNDNPKKNIKPVVKKQIDDDDELLLQADTRIQELQRRIDDLNREKIEIMQQSKNLTRDLQALHTKHENEKKEWEEAQLKMHKEVHHNKKLVKELQDKLINSEKTKQRFVKNAQQEIDRLSYVVNSLLHVDSCRQVAQLLVEESYQKSAGDSTKSNIEK